MYFAFTKGLDLSSSFFQGHHCSIAGLVHCISIFKIMERGPKRWENREVFELFFTHPHFDFDKLVLNHLLYSYSCESNRRPTT